MEFTSQMRKFSLLLLGSFLIAGLPLQAAHHGPSSPELPGEPGVPHRFADRSGVVSTAEGRALRLSADLGAIRVLTLEPGADPVVRYTVHIETDARALLAGRLLAQYSLSVNGTPSGVQIVGTLPPQSSHGRASEPQFWVRFEITVPRNYSLDVSTGAGDIETADIGGTATLITQGGNIRTGRISFNGLREVSRRGLVARLETEGGHITIHDVAGNLIASTGGGHINAGNIEGDASLHTGGGHIHAEKIAGHADLNTEGGNITVQEAGGTVAVRTGGGQIDFGEVRGSVRGQTGGGGIRILYVAGPMELETSGGSICLTRVAGAVRAETAGGTIRAWFNPDAPAQKGAVQLAGASQLTSGAGDIEVFLPRNLAATIEATVETGGRNRIQFDPLLPLNIEATGPRGDAVRATALLNGGGAVLRLKTGVGKIRLQYLDSSAELRQSLTREEGERIRNHLDRGGITAALNEAQTQPEDQNGDWLDLWRDTLEEKLRGGVSEDADALQKRLYYSPPPAYPALAKTAGIEGVVRLRVRIGKDGRVEVLRILEGEPVLADAAICAVKQWHYKPKKVNGRPVNVISEVAFNFQLR